MEVIVEMVATELFWSFILQKTHSFWSALHFEDAQTEEYNFRFYTHTEDICFIPSLFQYHWLGNDMNQFFKAR